MARRKPTPVPVQTSAPELLGDSNPATLPGFADAPRNPLAVIAGTREQFLDYCQKRSLPEGDAIHIAKTEDAAGRRFRAVVTTGTYFRLDNWQDLFSRCNLK